MDTKAKTLDVLRQIVEQQIEEETIKIMRDIYVRGYRAGFLIGFVAALCGALIFYWLRG